MQRDSFLTRNLMACISLTVLGLPTILRSASPLDNPAYDRENIVGSESITSEVKRCYNGYRRSIIYYKKLYKFLNKEEIAELGSHAAAYVLKQGKKKCRSSNYRKELQGLLSHHSGKLGLLLPTSGVYQGIGQEFSNAAHTFFKGRNNPIIEYDSRGEIGQFHKSLAHLVFKDKVSLLIGGATKQEAYMLSVWSERLMIPALILHNPIPLKGKKVLEYPFFISPSQAEMAKTLALYMQNQGLKRAAIFSPQKENILFIKTLVQNLGLHNSQAPKVIQYQQGDYDALSQSMKDLFKMSLKDRGEEAAEIVQQKEEEAKAAGKVFDPNQLLLPPEKTVDAIVILDSFTMVRHIAKILKFLKVPPLPLLGAQGWRAPELFDQQLSAFLVDSVFVDYIGDYENLPYDLKVSQKDNNKFFTSPEESVNLDFWLIGKHALDISDRVLSYLPEDRRQIPTILRSLRARTSGKFFQSSRVFNGKLQTNWPSFLFSIDKGTLRPLYNRQAEDPKLTLAPVTAPNETSQRKKSPKRPGLDFGLKDHF